MCRYRTVNIRRVRYHHGPNCTTQAAPPQGGRVRTPEDERFRREVVDLMMNSQPRDVPLREVVAEQAGPEQPTFQQLVIGQGAAASPADATPGRAAHVGPGLHTELPS